MLKYRIDTPARAKHEKYSKYFGILVITKGKKENLNNINGGMLSNFCASYRYCVSVSRDNTSVD